MREAFTKLLETPLNSWERQWLQERLDRLSVQEEVQLTAALLRTAPSSAREAVDCLLSLPDYQVLHPAGSYSALGRYVLRHELDLPPELEEHVDLERLGRRYEDLHPGIFVGGDYVACPPEPSPAQYDGHTLPQEELSWSVRLKLASPAKPEGVWLRLPDYRDLEGGPPGEMDMALDALKVSTVQECTLLEAQCVLPEVRDLMEYEDLQELIYDGQDLGFALDEAGQGLRDFPERLAAGLELEGCRTLRQAAEIAARVREYEAVPADYAEAYGRTALGQLKMDSERSFLLTGCIDLAACGATLLEQEGYQLNAAETAYIRRSGPEQDRQREPAYTEQETEMTMA